MARFRGSPQPDRTRIQAARISAARVQTASSTKKVRTDYEGINATLEEYNTRITNLESKP